MNTRRKGLTADRRKLVQGGMAFAFGSSLVVRPEAALRAMAQTPTSSPVASPSASPAVSADGGWGEFIAGTTPGMPDKEGGFVTIMPALPEGFPLNPPIEANSAKAVGGTTEFYHGDSINNSPFTRMMSHYLGINWSTKWQYSNVDDAAAKLNTAIAAGDLPDMLETLSLNHFADMLEADLIEDITDAWDQYASPTYMKDVLNYGGEGRAWAYAEVDGRMMGIPHVAVAAQDDKIMWIRQDWLDKVGMEIPTTVEEVEAVAEAFVSANLGADGVTVGLGCCQSLNTWYGSVDPLFGAYGVVPMGSGGYWTPEGDGLMYDGIREQQKQGLELMQRLYTKGLIPADFYTMDAVAVQELVAGNRCGLHFSPSFAAGYGIGSSIDNDPEAVWTFADIPAGPDGRRGKAWTNPYPQSVYAFRKGYEHVEDIIKQTAWLAELKENPENYFLGWEGYNFEINEQGEFDFIFGTPHKWYFGPIGGDSGAGMNPLREMEFQDWQASFNQIPENDRDAYQKYVTSADSVIEQLTRDSYAAILETSEEYGIKNEFLALPTESMKPYGASLGSLENEAILGIVKGDFPVDYFDEFVSAWKSSGGDQVTSDVNDWWAARQ